jgi:PAS domain S-box-containing protein
MEQIALLGKIFEAFAESSTGKYVFMRDMKTGVSRWSKSCVESFGLADEYMTDSENSWESLIHPEDRERYHQSINDLLSGKTDKHNLVYRIKDRTGEYVVCTCKGKIVYDEGGEPLYFAGTIDNHGVENEFDPVTNLYTKKRLLDRLRSNKESPDSYCILFIGMCNFAEINNIYGYDLGNRILRNFADKLMEYSSVCEIFHAGGTKYAVVSKELDLDGIKEIYDALKEFAKNDIFIEKNRVAINIAGACALIDNHRVDEHSIFYNGMMCLDDSINLRHGEIVVFSGNTVGENHERLAVISAIRNSINNGCEGFYLCFQPIVSSGNDKLVGAEALVRWDMLPFGNVPPGEFIPWIENDPFFYDLSNWILKTALISVKEKVLPKHPDFVLSVNISYMQLERSAFRNDLLKLIEETGYPTKNLCLELTERCRLLNKEVLRNEVIFIKSQGIKVALDDFGTGFSAMDLLLYLPVDGIKIDRSFVYDIEEKNRSRFVVEAVIKCAEDLGLTSTIEGIESDSMKKILKKYGATSFQGYLYSKPVVIDEFVNLPLAR